MTVTNKDYAAYEKAQKIADKAINIFNNSIKSLEKSNEILTNAIISNEEQMEKITKEIEERRFRITELKIENNTSNELINKNLEMISKIQDFIE